MNMKNPSKISIVVLVLFFMIGGYLLRDKTSNNQNLPSDNASTTEHNDNWVKKSSQQISGNDVFSRNVKISDGGFENQRITISSNTTELSPEEWVETQIDLNDVLVIAHEWRVLNDYKHLSITTKTVNDDAQIDYFFKNNNVISFVFQPLHALKDPDTNDYFLKIIDEYLSN